jgi:hypothetical protein
LTVLHADSTVVLSPFLFLSSFVYAELSPSKLLPYLWQTRCKKTEVVRFIDYSKIARKMEQDYIAAGTASGKPQIAVLYAVG